MRKYLMGLGTIPLVIVLFNLGGSVYFWLLRNVQWWHDELTGYDPGIHVFAALLLVLIFMLTGFYWGLVAEKGEKDEA